MSNECIMNVKSLPMHMYAAQVNDLCFASFKGGWNQAKPLQTREEGNSVWLGGYRGNAEERDTENPEWSVG